MPDPSAIGQKIANPMRFSQYYMIFLMASLNSFLLIMLADISDPFDGFWAVDKKPFDDLTSELGKELASGNRDKPVIGAQGSKDQKRDGCLIRDDIGNDHTI